jgi:hypothetical protein
LALSLLSKVTALVGFQLLWVWHIVKKLTLSLLSKLNKLKCLSLFCGTRVYTEGLRLAKQKLSHLSPVLPKKKKKQKVQVLLNS